MAAGARLVSVGIRVSYHDRSDFLLAMPTLAAFTRKKHCIETLATITRFAAATEEVILELSSLLRRVALARFGRRQVAGLTGEAWLIFLDKTGSTQVFTSGPGRIFITGPYQRQISVDIEKLYKLVKQWIRAS